MRSFGGMKMGETFVVSIERDELVLESIETFIQSEGIDAGVIVGGIATFDGCRLRVVTSTGYPSDKAYFDIAGPVEMCAVEGMIVEGKPHVHVVVGNAVTTYSGHLEAGCRALFLCEFVVARLDGPRLVRRPRTDRPGTTLERE